jgi:hypothetical protein
MEPARAIGNELDEDTVREHARRTLTSVCCHDFDRFIKHAWHVLEPNGRPFVKNTGTDAIIQHLQAVGDGQIRRLGIAVSLMIIPRATCECDCGEQ